MIAAVLAAASVGQPNLQALEDRLDKISANFGGRLGYRLEMLDGTGGIGERDKEVFPSASTIKTVLMVEAFKQIEEGKLKFTDVVKLWEKSRRHASNWAFFMEDNLSMNIDALISLMMSVSDNTTTVVLAEKLGAENIEKTMLGWGYQNTAWTSYPPAGNQRLTRLRQSFQNMGVTTPGEMARLMGAIGRKELINKAASEKMIRILSDQYWDQNIAWSVPPEIVVASKVGALNRSRSDAAIVFGPRPYVLTIYTDNQKDRRWAADNEGNAAIRRISSIVWNAVNRDWPYQPPKDAGKWMPTGGGVVRGGG